MVAWKPRSRSQNNDKGMAGQFSNDTSPTINAAQTDSLTDSLIVHAILYVCVYVRMRTCMLGALKRFLAKASHAVQIKNPINQIHCTVVFNKGKDSQCV